MDHFPIFLALRGERALVVGGSALAARKATLIAKSGAEITVIAPVFSAAMQALAQQNPLISLSTASFHASCLNGVSLVLAATDDDALNREVYAAAKARGLPVNVADQPQWCSYILPAIVDRSPVIVAVSTGGRSPVLARFVKALLERSLPHTLGTFSKLLKRWRQPVAEALADGTERRRFWEQQINGTMGQQALAGQFEDAELELQTQLRQRPQSSTQPELTLIGAPTHDPEMLSIKAHRQLQMAEWVFYDDDTPAEHLELGRREAHVFNVDRCSTWEAQRQLLSQLHKGRRVVRLYGRDSALDQEATGDKQLLAQHGICASVIAHVEQPAGAAIEALRVLSQTNRINR